MVDVTQRWLGEQGLRSLSFSCDVLPERHVTLEVVCAPSIVGILWQLPALLPQSSAAPSRPIAIASRCGTRDAAHDVLHNVGASDRPTKLFWQAKARDGEDFVEPLQNARRHSRSIVFQPAGEIA